MNELIQAFKARVRAELGDGAEVVATADGTFLVSIPARQYFEAHTLTEAIENAKKWKEMLTRE